MEIFLTRDDPSNSATPSATNEVGGNNSNPGNSASCSASPISILNNDDAIRRQFRDPDAVSVDGLGADVSIGRDVHLVSRGMKIDLDDGEKFTVFPGETVVLQTKEVLKLTDGVFATGSPKMSLLIKGLWSHGGKTDFGYSSNLMLSFRNMGDREIELAEGQSIFHLTFWHAGEDQVQIPPGSGASIYSRSIPSLDLNGAPSFGDFPENPLSEPVLKKDGILAYKVSTKFEQAQRKMNLLAAGLLGALLINFLIFGVQISGASPSKTYGEILGYIVQFGLLAILGIVPALVTYWLQQRGRSNGS